MESGEIHRFQMFDLNNTPPSTDIHHRIGTLTSVSPCNGRVRSIVRYSTGCPIKRRSPSPSSILQEPPTKRAAICHSSASIAVAGDGIENDAESDASALATPVKPFTSDTNLQNDLNRSLSETICRSSPEAGTLPPLPPLLPEADCTTPSNSLMCPSPSGSDQNNAGDESRRLRRIKERMKQMNQWIQKVTDDDEEDTIQNSMDTTNLKKTMSDEIKVNQEAVVVEENGENLNLHFNCPCGKGFEIFLSGRKCYYRLM